MLLLEAFIDSVKEFRPLTYFILLFLFFYRLVYELLVAFLF